jgi:hypothetical protein
LQNAKKAVSSVLRAFRKLFWKWHIFCALVEFIAHGNSQRFRERGENTSFEKYWKIIHSHKHLQTILAANDFQLGILRKSCENLTEYGAEWAANNPLIEVVAE